MGLIRISRPWTQQPQGLCKPNLSFLGARPYLLMNPSAGLVDVITGRMWTAGGNASTVVSPKGLAYNFDGVDDYLGNTTYPELTGNVGTVAIWMPRVGSTDNNGHILFSSNSPQAVYFQTDGNGAIYLWSKTGAGTLSGWYDTVNRSFVATSNGLAGGALAYIDGKYFGAATQAAVSWGTGAKNLRIGNYGGGNNWDFNGSMSVVCVCPNVWTAEQARAFHDNPFIVFAPQVTNLWTPEAVAPTGWLGAWGSRPARNIGTGVK
jgi:hypothetical protein